MFVASSCIIIMHFVIRFHFSTLIKSLMSVHLSRIVFCLQLWMFSMNGFQYLYSYSNIVSLMHDLSMHGTLPRIPLSIYTITPSYIQLYIRVLPDHFFWNELKNNWFQNKLVRQITNMYMNIPPPNLHTSKRIFAYFLLSINVRFLSVFQFLFRFNRNV